MNFKKYVELILEEFNMSMNLEKFNYSNFSVNHTYNEVYESYDYVLYSFSQNSPYLIFCLRNNTNKLSKQMIYVNSDPFLMSMDEDELGNTELFVEKDIFDYEEVTQIIANRIVEVFPYTRRYILIHILEEIMKSFRGITEKFVDERHSVIQSRFPDSILTGDSYDLTLNEIGNLTDLYSASISNALEEQRHYLLEALDYSFVSQEEILSILKEKDLKMIDESIYKELVLSTNLINHTLAEGELDFDIDLSSGESKVSDHYLESLIEKVNKIMTK